MLLRSCPPSSPSLSAFSLRSLVAPLLPRACHGDSFPGASLAKIIATVPAGDCYEHSVHVAWNDEAGKLGKQLFREQNVLLQAMKAEKKKKAAAAQ